MDNLSMDMFKGIGYLLIPGFAALFLFVSCFRHRARHEKVKAERSRHFRGVRK